MASPNLNLPSSIWQHLDFINPLVRSQRQAGIIYFDIGSTFDLIPHTLLLHKLSPFGLGDYANRFCRYLTDRQYQVSVSGNFITFEVFSGASHGPALGSLSFNVFINN